MHEEESFKVFIKTLNDIYPTFNFSVCNLLHAKRKTAEGAPPFAFGYSARGYSADLSALETSTLVK